LDEWSLVDDLENSTIYLRSLYGKILSFPSSFSSEILPPIVYLRDEMISFSKL
jgi:hypothetical protein